MAISIDNISVYLPKKQRTNEELATEFSKSAEQIFKNTGIKTRYVSAEGELASDMAVKAAEKLFTEQHIDKNNIDFLIFCSEGFDYKAPATSCIIQERLGLKNEIGCIDLPYGCSGYIYGLGIANGMIVSGVARRVLFLTADMATTVIHKNDLELKSIFSDIATASLISGNDKALPFVFGTDGKGHQNLIVRYSSTRDLNADFLKSETLPYGHMTMNSTEVFLFAVKRVPTLIQSILEKQNATIDEIDLFVFHQASFFMLDVVRRKCKIPKEKFFVNIEDYGNSVSSTIPVALYDAEKKGVLKRGMKVLLAGFGIGYSWGATIIDY